MWVTTTSSMLHPPSSLLRKTTNRKQKSMDHKMMMMMMPTNCFTNEQAKHKWNENGWKKTHQQRKGWGYSIEKDAYVESAKNEHKTQMLPGTGKKKKSLHQAPKTWTDSWFSHLLGIYWHTSHDHQNFAPYTSSLVLGLCIHMRESCFPCQSCFS